MVYFTSLTNGVTSSQYSTEDVKIDGNVRLARNIANVKHHTSKDGVWSTLKRSQQQNPKQNGFKLPIKSKRNMEWPRSEENKKHRFEGSQTEPRNPGVRSADMEACRILTIEYTDIVCINENICFEIVYTKEVEYCIVA